MSNEIGPTGGEDHRDGATPAVADDPAPGETERIEEPGDDVGVGDQGMGNADGRSLKPKPSRSTRIAR